MKILIVEDEVAQAESLKLLLEMHGHTVHIAFAPPSAKLLAETHTPDAVVLDLLMPMEGGRSFLAWLRGREETKSVPVVVTTGLPLDDPRCLAIQGPVLQKPFTLDELMAAFAEAQRCTTTI